MKRVGDDEKGKGLRRLFPSRRSPCFITLLLPLACGVGGVLLGTESPVMSHELLSELSFGVFEA